ncbi:type II secretion system F family protein [Thioalkalivibrio sp. ALE16]|uniref:type II secretion system F family protein n=1 Tax=Thioalkalivibrio sp. ALE16 TaxID=1158172 RepID=UPI0003679936|nr:type II secretion system F family protein [Thioalkalivibrio sp. ALE16]
MRAKLKFGAKERASLYRKMASMTAAGFPPTESIKKLNARHKARRNPLEFMTHDWIKRVGQGASLADALDGWADPAEVTIIAASDKVNDLQTGLQEAAELTEFRHKMTKMAVSKLTMPVVLLLSLFGLVYYIAATIVPSAQDMLPEEQMPDFAKAYFAFGEWMLDWGGWTALGVVALAIALVISFPIWKGSAEFQKKKSSGNRWEKKESLRDYADKAFPWTLYRSMQGAFFLLALSSMLRGGMTAANSIRSLSQYSTPWLRQHLSLMGAKLKGGLPESKALETGLLSHEMSDSLAIYGDLPDFAEAMKTIGDDAMSDLESSVSRISSLTSVAVMVLLAAFILATIFALGETSFAISDAVEQQSMGI